MLDAAYLLDAPQSEAHALYAQFRESNDGIHVIQASNWRMYFRYDDVANVLKHPQPFSSDRFWKSAAAIHDENNPIHRRYVEIFRQSLLVQDAPNHARLRELVRHTFTPRLIGQMAAAVEGVVDELLDSFEPDQEIDFVAAFAHAVPLWTIASILGVPVEDREQFGVWSAGFATPFEFSCVGEARDRAIGHAHELLVYLEALIDRRRVDPADDLIGVLLAAEQDGDRLTADELLAMVSLLLVAGNETTRNLLSSSIDLLLQHPDQHRLLAGDPSLIDTAIDEFLRYEPPFRWIGRIMGEAAELEGTAVDAGTWIYVCVAAANRDPRQFADPERLDLTRARNRHLSFGHGVHFCLGAPLARLEARIALPRVLARFPNLRRGDSDPRHVHTFNFRQLEILPVRL